MSENYAYLVGIIGLGIVFGFLCYIRKDLRKAMVYSGLLYLIFMTAVFVLLKMVSSDPAKAINPGYWSPPSFFDLNGKTGGYGIEDVFYMFFVGAIAAGLYNALFRLSIGGGSSKSLKKGPILLGSLLLSCVVYVVLPINVVDFL